MSMCWYYFMLSASCLDGFESFTVIFLSYLFLVVPKICYHAIRPSLMLEPRLMNRIVPMNSLESRLLEILSRKQKTSDHDGAQDEAKFERYSRRRSEILKFDTSSYLLYYDGTFKVAAVRDTPWPSLVSKSVL